MDNKYQHFDQQNSGLQVETPQFFKQKYNAICWLVLIWPTLITYTILWSLSDTRAAIGLILQYFIALLWHVTFCLLVTCDPGIILKQPDYYTTSQFSLNVEPVAESPKNSISADDDLQKISVQQQLQSNSPTSQSQQMSRSNAKCQTCDAAIYPRSQHCDVCRFCFDNWSHHNVFLGVCIAGANYRLYCQLLISTTFYFLFLLGNTIVLFYTNPPLQHHRYRAYYPLLLIGFIVYVLAMLVFVVLTVRAYCKVPPGVGSMSNFINYKNRGPVMKQARELFKMSVVNQ